MPCICIILPPKNSHFLSLLKIDANVKQPNIMHEPMKAVGMMDGSILITACRSGPRDKPKVHKVGWFNTVCQCCDQKIVSSQINDFGHSPVVNPIPDRIATLLPIFLASCGIVFNQMVRPSVIRTVKKPPA